MNACPTPGTPSKSDNLVGSNAAIAYKASSLQSTGARPVIARSLFLMLALSPANLAYRFLSISEIPRFHNFVKAFPFILSQPP